MIIFYNEEETAIGVAEGLLYEMREMKNGMMMYYFTVEFAVILTVNKELYYKAMEKENNMIVLYHVVEQAVIMVLTEKVYKNLNAAVNNYINVENIVNGEVTKELYEMMKEENKGTQLQTELSLMRIRQPMNRQNQE